MPSMSEEDKQIVADSSLESEKASKQKKAADNIIVNDFGLFCTLVKSAAKVVDSAKFIVDETGV